MPATNALFTGAELAGWLHMPAGSITDDVVDVVELVVWGWMKPALELDVRPATLTDDQKAWAIELGGIAYSNPEGLAKYALESETSEYNGSARKEILAEVAGGGTHPTGAPPAPTFRAPARTADDCYPDPARPNGRGTYGYWPT